jgi:hypothetical protein
MNVPGWSLTSAPLRSNIHFSEITLVQNECKRNIDLGAILMRDSSDQGALMTPALLKRANTADLVSALDAVGPFGPRGAGTIAAGFLQRPEWSPDPDCVMFPGSGRQAIASAVAALAMTDDRVGPHTCTDFGIEGRGADSDISGRLLTRQKARPSRHIGQEVDHFEALVAARAARAARLVLPSALILSASA